VAAEAQYDIYLGNVPGDVLRMFAIPDTDSMPISGALCICGSLCGFLQMEVLSLSIFNQSGITIIQLQR
jgi:hypothetical protein